ncbi:MAG TPA: hypothetical protein H9778_04220 [Candidatus Parabacteroides intestinavium]|nr:hypothetical protein [Candidatus Parabacteroides intestinavium]
MKTNWKWVAMLLAASMTFTACSDDNNDEPTPNPDPTPGVTNELSENITEDMILEAGQEYTLNGGIHVTNGATLTIEPGVTITAVHDDQVDYILVEQGAQINAVGTAENPIVMTSESKESGAWGGLHICGYAHTNAEGGTGSSEIGGAAYGGDDDADNSGTLQYVRLEYTGYAFDEEHESNGISFYGVGNGTTVDHCQVYGGADDGFEFFGGSVNVKYLVATDCEDDSFDWTEGWNGKGQFLVATQASDVDSDCLMECDNNGNNYAATPVAHPVLANLTLIGNGGDAQGIRLRAGTQVELYNALVSGKALPLTVETTETEQALADGTSIINNVSLSGELTSEEGIYTNDMFVEGEGNLTNQELPTTVVGTTEGGATPSDSFFESADYRGAVSSDNDWTSGWTL